MTPYPSSTPAPLTGANPFEGGSLDRRGKVMLLGDYQRQFTYMLGRLLVWVCEVNRGYATTIGDGYRTPEQATLNAAKGIGIVNSLHTRRLAIDLNLFINGVYQTDTNAYLPLGEYWEFLGGSWGGRFSKPDGNHFSLSPDGGKTR